MLSETFFALALLDIPIYMLKHPSCFKAELALLRPKT